MPNQNRHQIRKRFVILHTLLLHAASRKMYLVYCCNRKFRNLQFEAIVQRQLLEELGKVMLTECRCIVCPGP